MRRKARPKDGSAGGEAQLRWRTLGRLALLLLSAGPILLEPLGAATSLPPVGKPAAGHPSVLFKRHVPSLLLPPRALARERAMAPGLPLLSVAPVSAYGFLRHATNPVPAALSLPRAPLPRPASPAKAMAAPLAAPVISGPAIVFDHSLGQTGQPAPGSSNGSATDYLVTGSMGQQMGGNLFFSFAVFGLATNDSVTFSGPEMGVHAVLARVTGGSASYLDGTLHNQFAGSSFFLMNPAGVMFGPNAKLDVTGAFSVTTADYLRLGQIGRFDARDPSQDVLTADTPSAFGFSSPHPTAISVGAVSWSLPTVDLTIVAGGITLAQATIANPAGRVSLVSVGGPGSVILPTASQPVDASGMPLFGPVSVQGGSLTTAPTDPYFDPAGGSVALYAADATFIATSWMAGNGGTALPTFSLIATRLISLDSSSLETTGGSFEVRAGSLQIGGTGGGLSALDVGGNPFSGLSSPAPGNLNVTVAGALMLTANGGIFSAAEKVALTSASASLSAGFQVQAPQVSLSATGTVRMQDAGTMLLVDFTAPRVGAGISVTAGLLEMTGGASIQDRQDSAQGMGLTVQADTLRLSDAGTQILADGSSSKAGILSIEAGSVDLQAGAEIAAHGQNTIIDPLDTFLGVTAAPRLKIQTDRLTLAGLDTAVDAESQGAGSPGEGTITLLGRSRAGALQIGLSDGAVISTERTDGATGGDISVTASSLTISGTAGSFTGLEASSPQDIVDVSIPSGAITIRTGSLSIHSNGPPPVGAGAPLLTAGITTSTVNAGNAGAIHVRASSILLSGLGSEIFSESGERGISGQTGDSGRLSIQATDISLRSGARLVTSTQGSGNAGAISLTSDRLLISGGASGAPTGVFSERLSLGLETSGGTTFIQELSGAGGDVTLNTGDLILANGGVFDSDTQGTGRGGRVQIFASRSVSIAGGAAETGLFSRSDLSEGLLLDADGSGVALKRLGGPAGAISVATPLLTLTHGAQISTSTSGYGNAGDITLTVQSATFNGAGGAGRTGVLSEATLHTEGGRKFIDSQNVETIFRPGNSGNILIQASDEVQLLGGAEVTTSTSGSGNAGRITIDAASLRLAGASDRPSQISSQSLLRGTLPIAQDGVLIPGLVQPGGAGGDIALQIVGEISLSDGAQINASTSGLGKGGGIQAAARQIILTGPGTEISVATLSPRAGGDGGAIQMEGAVSLSGRASLLASTAGEGRGGDIVVTGSVLVSGHGSTVSADSNSSGRGGAGGDIRISGDASLAAGGAIEASTHGLGAGGSITVRSPDPVTLSGGSSLVAESFGGGRSGLVQIEASEITLTRATIATANRGAGLAGNISLTATQDILLQSGSEISTMAAQGTAGQIAIAARSSLRMIDSAITAAAGADGGDLSITVPGTVFLTRSTLTAAAVGNGGNILIDPAFFILDRSPISADSLFQRGGNITLVAADFLDSESAITATGAQSGTVNIVAPELDLTNGLASLSGSLLDVSHQLRDLCARRLQQDFSSFLVLGQGSVASSPDSAQPTDSTGRPPPSNAH